MTRFRTAELQPRLGERDTSGAGGTGKPSPLDDCSNQAAPCLAQHMCNSWGNAAEVAVERIATYTGALGQVVDPERMRSRHQELGDGELDRSSLIGGALRPSKQPIVTPPSTSSRKVCHYENCIVFI
jgi:hypothetical protein